MPFLEHPDAETRCESAVRAAKAILELDLYPAHKRELLKVCIWKITEAHGKYTTRIRSRKSLSADSSKLAHEHVWRMEKLISALVDRQGDVASILGRAVGCTVTRDEHRLLSNLDRAEPDIDGWERYRKAGIEVIDTLTGEPHPPG